MRVLAVCGIIALGGCSQVAQDISENVSNVVYTVVEPSVPRSLPLAPQISLRPIARPEAKPVVYSLGIIEAITQIIKPSARPVDIAYSYIGMHERTNVLELTEFLGLDPRQTEWCAAFVNSSLNTAGFDGSEAVSPYPLMARSFLEWGTPVPFKEDPSAPRIGDIAVFPRGRNSWQGHVGFYISTVIVDNKVYWKILSGNQNNQVTVNLYPASRALGLRRLAKYTVAEPRLFSPFGPIRNYS